MDEQVIFHYFSEFGDFFVGVLLLFLCRWLLRWFFLIVRKHKTPLYQSMLTAVLNWCTYFAILLFTFVYWDFLVSENWSKETLFSLGDVNVSIVLIIVLIMLVSLANRLSKVMTRLLFPKVYDYYDFDKGIRFTLNRVFHYTLMVIAVFVSLHTAGVNLSALSIFAGVIGVGIGFGLQNLSSNFIAGIILLMERPIQVGDRVEVDGVTGDIEDIQIRAAVVRTLTNEHMIIPNSYFLEKRVTNLSHGDTRLRVDLPVNVSYAADVKQARRIMLDVVQKEIDHHVYVLSDPAPAVQFREFGDLYLNLVLQVWVSDPVYMSSIKSRLNEQIHEQFHKHRVPRTTESVDTIEWK
ncbi:mechanosensitive ion channel family protein [Salibacterium aidingense]|uniref:mechanosensitive ion channel family protein n=1 Tax=Salibacterium aidingense TaxID=384933 RepID=UPI00040B8B14|nr:mechanosensitive ion channel domain-containing protein [Salibacterium aidingense]